MVYSADSILQQNGMDVQAKMQRKCKNCGKNVRKVYPQKGLTGRVFVDIR
jgi:hypothetical protein